MAELVLEGIHPEPLAQYLSALGILRLVAEQADADACGCWRGDSFVLRSRLDADGLVEFFVRDYRPSPIVGPWNGGSGFWAKDNTEGMQAILDSTDDRFSAYKEVVRAVQGLLEDHEFGPKLDKSRKSELIARLRSELPDEALGWIDAALVLTNDGERYPPLLGTGGNDGRLEFSNNFMRRVARSLLGDADPRLLQSHLFGESGVGLVSAPIGQFSPAQAGGANASTGFDGDARVNPWAYLLMLEGALVPAGAATRRLESNRGGSLAFPFAVRSAAVGYASAGSEKNRDELWLPLWTAPATFVEIRQLFAEGRAKVPCKRGSKFERREAVDGLDFARAISSLGVNRGIDAFVRYGFQERNGLAFFAVPLGRWVVRSSKGADLLVELDSWLARLRAYVGSGKAPASVASAARRLDAAIIDACQRDEWSTILEIMVCLGELESTLARAKDRPLDPIESLSASWFFLTREDPSVEYRLAASLASAGIRPRLRPVVPGKGRRWVWAPSGSKATTWMQTASLEENLLALLRRREIEQQQGQARVPHFDARELGITDAKGDKLGAPRCWASLSDVVAFIDGPEQSGIDLQRLEALIGALSLIDWKALEQGYVNDGARVPPASFALLALAHGLEDPGRPNQLLPATPGMLANAAAGRLDEASRRAIRRLRTVGLEFPIEQLGDERGRARRIAAALAFPLAGESLARLKRLSFPLEPDNATEPSAKDLHP